MPSQTSFRLPPELLRALDRLARKRGVPKSQLVREALEQFLTGVAKDNVAQPMSVRERSAPYIGSLSRRDSSAIDEVAIQIRQRNWRD